MESQEQRNSKKTAITVIIAVLIIGGGFAAYKCGLIPGFGDGEKVAQELKAQTEALKGTAVKDKLIAYYNASPRPSKEQKEQVTKLLNEQIDMNFGYADIKTSSGDGKGSVDIISPTLNVTSHKDNIPYEISAPELIVSRDVMDKNHYFFHSFGSDSKKGLVEIYTNEGGTKTKVLSITSDDPYNEIKVNDDGFTGYVKSTAKNIAFTEGRGGTVVFTIGEKNIEFKQSKNNDQISADGKIALQNIVPGDMVKMVLGQINPLSFNFNYSYSGDDINQSLQDMLNYPQRQMEEAQKAANDPTYKPQTLQEPSMQPFNGHLKIDQFSLLMGDAGIVAKTDLTFRKDNARSIPSGDVTLTIAQYQKLIDYIKKFMPIPDEESAKSIKFLSEIGQNSNGNVTITLTLNGTDEVKIGGKSLKEVQEIQGKYFPPVQINQNAPLYQPGVNGAPTVQVAPAAPAAANPAPAVKPAAPADANKRSIQDESVE